MGPIILIIIDAALTWIFIAEKKWGKAYKYESLNVIKVTMKKVKVDKLFPLGWSLIFINNLLQKNSHT